MGWRDALFGPSKAEQQQKAVMDYQHDQALHRDLASKAAYNDDGYLSREYLQTMVEHGIDEQTAIRARNLLSKDFVLANYTHAEAHEAKWLARVEALALTCQHPMQESVYQGAYRQFAFDDPDEGLKALTSEEASLLQQVVLDIFARISRGDGGFQQEMFQKTIMETNTGGGGSNETSGWFG